MYEDPLLDSPQVAICFNTEVLTYSERIVVFLCSVAFVYTLILDTNVYFITFSTWRSYFSGFSDLSIHPNTFCLLQSSKCTVNAPKRLSLWGFCGSLMNIPTMAISTPLNHGQVKFWFHGHSVSSRYPPSTGNPIPVTQAALSLARNKAAFAGSRASLHVPQGVLSVTQSLIALSSVLSLVIAVRATTMIWPLVSIFLKEQTSNSCCIEIIGQG